MAEPDRLQLGEPVAAAGVADEDWSLVADQLATATSEDGWAIGEARPVLSASVGRGPSDAQGVQRDSAADLGATLYWRSKSWWLAGTKEWRRKEVGMVELSEELRRNAPKFRLDPSRKGWRRTFHGYC